MPTVAEDLALDEALLEAAEANPTPIECLRWWEPTSLAVVVGRSSRLSAEVSLANCQADGVPVVRRTSGGAAIVAGPGCLMYSLVLSIESRPELRDVSFAHRFVLDHMIASIARLVPGVKCRGTSDLVIGDKKISGNSLRQRRRNLLYHGTLLYDFPLETISRYLIMPPRMPDYRAARSHGEFVANLPLKGAALRAALAVTWAADVTYPDPPLAVAKQLAQEKYATAAWNEQLK
ncbi:MAG: lipoate--protein ligase family protein [Planctomycetia bacterium]|nr:lipoate--protein ligase family protein [Planctomycetia bacterium]